MKFLKIFTVILVILALSSIFYFMEDIKKSSVFNLKKIVITDIPHYSFNDLVEKVAIKKDISIFEIDLSNVEKQLLELLWIKKVNVTRILPSKISVSIEEHKIKGVVLLDMLYFYNNDYNIFLKAYPSEIKKQIIYSGLDINDYENDFPLFKKKLVEMENINKIFKTSKLANSCSISEMALTNFRGYQINMKCDKYKEDINILLGNKDFLQGFNRSQVILNKSKERKEKLESIIFDELKSKNSVIVRLKKEEEIDG